MTLLATIFTFFTQTFTLNPIWAITGALIWGMLSILLSPCHLASIPFAIGLINGKGAVSHKRAFAMSFLFSIGILVSIALIGLITSLLGRMLGDIGNVGLIAVGTIFVLIALWLAGWINLPFPNFTHPEINRTGGLPALLFGALFGLALGPCAFGFMMPLLAVVFQVAGTQLWLALSLVAAFSLGHISIIIMAGTGANWVQRYLNWNSQSKGTQRVKKLCGLLIGMTGVLILYSTLQRL